MEIDNMEIAEHNAVNDINDKYPGRIPIIIKPNSNIELKNKHKVKYLVPHDSPLSQLLLYVRKNVNCGPEQSIYLLSNNTMLPLAVSCGEIYKQYTNGTSFLYIDVVQENVFG
jgi:hypothetical protein